MSGVPTHTGPRVRMKRSIAWAGTVGDHRKSDCYIVESVGSYLAACVRSDEQADVNVRGHRNVNGIRYSAARIVRAACEQRPVNTVGRMVTSNRISFALHFYPIR